VIEDPQTDGTALALTLREAAGLPADTVLKRLLSSRTGLTNAEAARRLVRIGPNVLREHHVTVVGVFLRQIRNPLLILLLVAALVSGVTGDPTDASIIGGIVVLSVGLGLINEYRSERAVAALHAKVHHFALVYRDRVQQRIDVHDLVPGDVLTIAIGDIVPADLRLLEATQLECDESMLTGESLPCAKSMSAVEHPESDVDLPSCAFMGTLVHQGGGLAVVVETGSTTAFGKIAIGLDAPSAVTGFQVGLKDFSKLLVWVAGVLTVSIFIINVALSRPIIDALLFSLAIAIGITPQLLPAIVSVSLATGARELAKHRVLVKRLVTIEDLGNIRTLFTDKTGTLTDGTVTFDQSLDAAGRESSAPLFFGLVCNEATLTAQGIVGGNQLDQALWGAPAAASLTLDGMQPSGFTRVATLPFDHERQLVSVVVVKPDGTRTLVTKGAPEVVLARCAHGSATAADVLDTLFAKGSRVVAVGVRDASGITVPTGEDEHDLELIGFLTFRDPPKADAGESIAKLNALGIDVKIITGDNGTVAATVCRDIGLELQGILTGTQIAELDDEALAAALPTTTVFARVSPEQKSRIIKTARHRGDDVAFLGDGVNDAVALHAADVGISVESATDVAKDAADIVLLDKDLGVLAEGVMEGRRIFANTLKFIFMATSSNFGNMFSAAGASLFLRFLPMLPSQILLNNMLYNVGQFAIPSDRVDAEVLARPAHWDIGFIRRFMIVFGPLSSIFDFMTFWVMLGVLHADATEFRTGWFVESIATQTLVIFLIRTRRVPFFRSMPSRGMLTIPTAMACIGAVLPFTPLAHVLGFSTLPVTFFLILGAMVLAYLALVEFAKSRFYAWDASRMVRPSVTEVHRRIRRVNRRASRFVRHRAP
jgi:P-type Mg2+ transporter